MNNKISFIAPQIIRACSRSLLAVYFFSFAMWYCMADGLKDNSGTPLGADFLNVYAAGLLADRGEPWGVYDWTIHGQVEQSVAGYASPYFGWHYPPMFLALAGLVALAPYLWAFACYIAISFAGYWTVIRRIASQSETSLWILAAFPGAFVNGVNGQNGFITTALFGAGLLELETKPWIAGIFFGLLCYKPQFFIVIPFVLAISGYGRAFLSTIMTAAASALLSWFLFGTATWIAFFDSTRLTQHIILEQGSTGWHKIQSIFSLARMWGAGVSAAYTLQIIIAIAALSIAAWVWRSRAALDIRAAALCGAMLLTTPYLLDYDLVILAVPLAFLLQRGLKAGFFPYEKTLLASLWALPLLARGLSAHLVPLTPFILSAMMIMCLKYAQSSKEERK